MLKTLLFLFLAAVTIGWVGLWLLQHISFGVFCS